MLACKTFATDFHRVSFIVVCYAVLFYVWPRGINAVIKTAEITEIYAGFSSRRSVRSDGLELTA